MHTGHKIFPTPDRSYILFSSLGRGKLLRTVEFPYYQHSKGYVNIVYRNIVKLPFGHPHLRSASSIGRQDDTFFSSTDDPVNCVQNVLV